MPSRWQLQRRYFGGIQITQQFYDWATSDAGPRTGLDALLASPPSADDLRSGGRHRLVCDHDTMFHPMQGVIGLKVVEARGVDVRGLVVEDLRNAADRRTWICGHRWQVPGSEEDVAAIAQRAGPPQASSVRGIEVVRSDDVSFCNVVVERLKSDEGVVKGIEVVGDDNDRTDHEDDTGVAFERVTVRSLSAAVKAMSFTSDSTPLSTKGITYTDVEEIDATLRNPRVVLNYQAVNTGPPNPAPIDAVQRMMTVTDLDTIEKVKGFRNEVLEFFKGHYGICFEDDAAEKYGPSDIVPALTRDCQPTDSFVTGVSLLDSSSFQYHASSVCVSDAGGGESNCTDAEIAPVHDFPISFVVGPSGYTFHGAFGSDQGQFSPAGNFIVSAAFSLICALVWGTVRYLACAPF